MAIRLSTAAKKDVAAEASLHPFSVRAARTAKRKTMTHITASTTIPIYSHAVHKRVNARHYPIKTRLIRA